MKTPIYFIRLAAILIFTLGIMGSGLSQNNVGRRNIRKLYLSATVPDIDKTRETKILTAFFGLDNGLTQRARLIYRKAPGKDGMPLVFSHELDPETLDGADFEVTT